MFDFFKKLSFENIITQGKPLLVTGICFVAVFLAGFGTGKSKVENGASNATKRSLNNYTTNSSSQTKTQMGAKNSTQNTQPTVDSNNCSVKGSKSKIYHLPGGAFYERTNPFKCFNTEEEALAAGFVKSSR